MKNKRLLFFVPMCLVCSLSYPSIPKITDRSKNSDSLQKILLFKKNITPENLSYKDQIAWSYFIRLQARLFDLVSYQQGVTIDAKSTISYCDLLCNKQKSITPTDSPEVYKALQETVQLSKKLIAEISNNSK